MKFNQNSAVIPDIGTREKSLKFFNRNVWRYDAEFLYNNESEWLPQGFIISKVNEMKQKSNRECILISKVETSELDLGNIVDVSRHDSIAKIVEEYRICGMIC